MKIKKIIIKNLLVMLIFIISAAIGTLPAIGRTLVKQHAVFFIEPTIALLIDNDQTSENVLLIQFQDIEFLYSPIIRQVFIKNISATKNYYLGYTILGNTPKLGTVFYAAIPAGTPSAEPIIIKPGGVIYFTPTTQYNSNYDVSAYNAKMIWQDMTVSDDEGDYFQCNKNNQHVGKIKNINRILMSCLTLKNQTYNGANK